MRHVPLHTSAIAFVAAALLAGAASHAGAQPTAAQQSAIRASCRADFMAQCAGVKPGGADALQCLTQHASDVSPACKQALAAIAKPASAPIAAAPAAQKAAPAGTQAAVGSPAPGAWPHAIVVNGTTATVYQPQVVAWPDRRTLNTRMAIGLQRAGATTPTLGTLDVAFDSSTDLATRTVTLTAPRLIATHFPTLATTDAAQAEANIRTIVAGVGPKTVPLDTVLLSLNRNAIDKPANVAVNNDPPRIVYSDRPASLLVFDGDPVWSPVQGTSLKFAVNTNWDVFATADNTLYWLNNGGWLTAANVQGPWQPAARVPAEFSKIPADSNFADVKKMIPGRTFTAATMPAVFVSTKPAEIIVTDGPPKFAPLPPTPISYVVNTNANLFYDTRDSRYYVMTSGRWFAATSLQGPWTFATTSLPPEFAQIPPSSPRGSVLASVPGTPQAQEALIQASIPTQGTLSRANAKLVVVYSGSEPKFEPIAGTPMFYAVNTPYSVIRVDATYYAVYQGAWFKAPTPTGPWVLADSIPPVIYTIPPSSPLYNVTYVQVYNATPEYVTYGYTSGYTMGYVSAGVVVYGTGYYYPPYYYPAPIPIWYPYPYSYSGSVWYNPNTGAWARGGTVYGPYGGAVSGGTAYNPNTGAWAHGGAIYGPNGGAGAWSAYNPETGRYAHGSATWNGSSGTANASFYNNRTGVSAATNQNYNQYGRWGSSVINTPNQTIHTQSQSNANGSAGSFNSSTGAKGAGVHGANGNNAGVVKGAGGDVYAGADGNVYRKTDDGWQKWNDGSWSQPQQPAKNAQNDISGQTRQSPSSNNISGETRQNPAGNNISGETQGAASQRQSARSQDISGQTERGGQYRDENFNGLQRDSEARTTGAQRQMNYQRQMGGMRGGGGGGRRR